MLNRLTTTQKFYIIGMVLSIPIIVSSFAWIDSLVKEYKEMEWKRNGIQLEQELLDIFRDVEHVHTLLFQNLKAEKIDVTQIEDAYDNVIEKVSALATNNQVGKFDHYLERMENQLKLQWENLSKRPQAETVNLQYQQFMQNMLEFLSVVSHESKLFQTKSNDRYYLIHQITYTIPRLINQLGDTRGKAVEILVNRKITADEFRELSASITATKMELQDLLRENILGLDVNDTTKNRLHWISESVPNYVESYLSYVEDHIITLNIYTVDLETFLKLSAYPIDEVFHYYDLTLIEIESMIGKEENSIQSKSTFVVIICILFFFFTIYCFIGLYISIRQLMKASTETLEKINRSLSHKILTIQEEERKRVSSELHDSIGQSLYSILVSLNILDSGINEKEKKEILEKTKEVTANAMEEVKGIARSLRPSALDDLGFIPALRSFIKDFSKVHDLDISFTYSDPAYRFSPEVETALFRISQESLNNIAKYAHATEVKVHVDIDVHQKKVSLFVTDNGTGFDITEKLNSGLGLDSMKERAEGLGGRFQLTSAIGEGTKIKVEIPF